MSAASREQRAASSERGVALICHLEIIFIYSLLRSLPLPSLSRLAILRWHFCLLEGFAFAKFAIYIFYTCARGQKQASAPTRSALFDFVATIKSESNSGTFTRCCVSGQQLFTHPTEWPGSLGDSPMYVRTCYVLRTPPSWSRTEHKSIYK